MIYFERRATCFHFGIVISKSLRVRRSFHNIGDLIAEGNARS